MVQEAPARSSRRFPDFKKRAVHFLVGIVELRLGMQGEDTLGTSEFRVLNYL